MVHSRVVLEVFKKNKLFAKHTKCESWLMWWLFLVISSLVRELMLTQEKPRRSNIGIKHLLKMILGVY